MGATISYMYSLLGWGPQYDVTPDPTTGLSEKDLALIRGSWRMLGDLKTRKAHGVELFIQLFRAYPYMCEEYFPWFNDMSDEELRTSRKMKAHAHNVMNNIGSYVEVCDDPESLVALIGKMAETHIPRNVKALQFKELGDMFLPYLVSMMGAAATTDVQEAWRRLLAALVAVVTQTEEEMS